MSSVPPSYRGHRYPVEVISHCVWRYFRLPLSFREAGELLLARGVIVSYGRVWRWCAKFGQAYAGSLRRRRPRPGDTWHLDEVFVRINGEPTYRWRAVDAGGTVLDILVQNRWNKAAARRFFRRLLKRTGAVPRAVITDKLRSYGVARRELTRSVEHRQSTYLNNRAENSHQPTRRHERAMKSSCSAGAAQRLLSAFSGISPHFRPRRHLMTAAGHHAEMTLRFAIWDQITKAAGRPQRILTRHQPATPHQRDNARPSPRPRTPAHPLIHHKEQQMFTGCAPPAAAGTGIDPNRIRVNTTEHGAAPAHAAAEVLSTWLDGAESVL